MKQGIRETVFTGGMLGDAALGSGSGHALAQQLAATINTPNSTVYDKAIDSVYLSTHTGGSQLHHLVDGQHDIFGAFEAAARALPGDSLWQEVMGAAQHLGKDLFSVSGSAGAALAEGSGLAALGSGLLPTLGGLILSVVVGMYVRRFLLKFLGVAADTPVQLREAHESLPEWKMPHMSPVEVEVWREMLNYPYQVDDDVRRMLQKALRD